jgi:hypothetical protein
MKTMNYVNAIQEEHAPFVGRVVKVNGCDVRIMDVELLGAEPHYRISGFTSTDPRKCGVYFTGLVHVALIDKSQFD